jgi:hypothetical protein
MRFLLLTEGLEAQPAGTDEQTRAYNQRWIEWAGGLIRSGTLVAGGPLTPAATLVTRDGASDLPLQRQDIYGYLLVNAGSLEEAVGIARQAPHTELGGRTIVRPCIDLPGPA